MGKLIETLERAGKATGGASFGFAGRAQASNKPKAAAILATVAKAGDLDGILKAGVDAVILPPDLAGEAATAAGVAWGVDARAARDLDAARLDDWHARGADFVLVPLSAPARIMAEKADHLDRLLLVAPPTVERDPLLMGLRSLNFLRADAAALDVQLSARETHELTIEAMARLRALAEALRFPVVLSLAEVPDEADLKTLVRLGVEGLWLAGATAAGVQILRERLERIPRESESVPRLGAALGAAGQPG